MAGTKARQSAEAPAAILQPAVSTWNGVQIDSWAEKTPPVGRESSSNPVRFKNPFAEARESVMSQITKVDFDIDRALALVSERESQVRTMPLVGPVQVDLNPRANRLWLTVDGLVIQGKLDAALMHQFGSRIWLGVGRTEVVKLWRKTPAVTLADKLARVLSHSGLVLRYRDSVSGLEIYGLTSRNFVEMDQRHFRNVLVEAMRPLGIAPSGQAFETAYREVVEEFDLPTSRGEVGLTCRVIYGLNTGYSSYRLRWGRLILVCTNGMTSLDSVAPDRWLHSGDVEIARFVDASVHRAYDHLSVLERKIIAASARPMDDARVDQFLSRLVMATATKQRIASRLDVEFSGTGQNEWSLSQALTYLGTHERAISPRVRGHLTRLGSGIVDGSLDAIATSTWLNPVSDTFDASFIAA